MTRPTWDNTKLQHDKNDIQCTRAGGTVGSGGLVEVLNDTSAYPQTREI